MRNDKLITIKTSKEALQLLRMVAAITGEKQYEVMERALTEELEKQRKQQNVR